MNATISWQSTFIGACLALVALSACSSRTVQEKGAEMAAIELDMATDIANGLQAKGTKAGMAVVTGAGKPARGEEQGMMRPSRAIIVDPTLASAGLNVPVINDIKGDPAGVPLGLSAYVVSSVSASGTLRAQMFDAMNNEIGRTSVRIDRRADEAKYEALMLDPEVKRSSIRKIAFVFTPGAAS